jgi:hypothetical protein
MHDHPAATGSSRAVTQIGAARQSGKCGGTRSDVAAGPDWRDRIAPLRRKRQLIAGLERLSGMKVTLKEAAA